MNGKKFKKLLLKHNITVKKYAEDMGCSLKHVYNLINEEYEAINWKPVILYFEQFKD